VEYDYPFGQKELYGLAYRGEFDLASHQKASGQDLQYTDPETNEKYLPHVIEPTWGVDRSVLVALLEAYVEEEAPTAEEGETDKRIVLKFPYWLAPIKVAVLPLSKKLAEPAQRLLADLSKNFTCDYDETQSIGKRYRRQDEIGTPFCVTVDFDTEKDSAVTIRERDTMVQVRVPMVEVAGWIQDKLSNPNT
jgi:glycyl-tRNA synthetase